MRTSVLKLLLKIWMWAIIACGVFGLLANGIVGLLAGLLWGIPVGLLVAVIAFGVILVLVGFGMVTSGLDDLLNGR